MTLVQIYLRKVLHYNRTTGEFFWRVDRGRKIKAGMRAGCFQKSDPGYVVIRLGDKLYLAHRLAWFYVKGVWPRWIDHINGRRTDNSWKNLRDVTPTQSGQNVRRHKDALSQFKGIRRDCTGKRWEAVIFTQGKRKWLGTHDTEAGAATLYDRAARKFHGNYARVNFPRKGEQSAL